MNELLQAAKRLVKSWDTGFDSPDIKDDFRAAVERAEKQEAVGFDAWMKAYMDDGPDFPPSAIHGWRAGQQAERERIKDIVAELLDPIDPWIHYSTLLEKIDEIPS